MAAKFLNNVNKMRNVKENYLVSKNPKIFRKLHNNLNKLNKLNKLKNQQKKAEKSMKKL